MQPPQISAPWETVSTDLVGPLPQSKMGKCYIAVFQDRFIKWVQCKAPELVFAINTARHDFTAYTPAFLNYGRDLDPPGALYRQPDYVNDESDMSHQTGKSAATPDRFNILQELFKLVRINLARAYTAQSRPYNLRHREWRCHIGNRVWRREHQLSSLKKKSPPN